VAASGGTFPYTFSWDNGFVGVAQLVSPDSSTSFIVSLTDGNSCPASGTVEVTVMASPNLTMGAMIDVTNFGSGSAFVTASGSIPPYTYLWDDPLAQQTDSAVGLFSGYYTVLVADGNGCTSSDSVFVSVNLSSVKSINLSYEISVYPNPNTGLFTFYYKSSETGSLKLSISNYLGQEVYTQSFLDFKGTFNTELNLSTQAPGVYNIQLTTDKQAIVSRVVVE